jgi:broad specificity phosphatase PhoE
MPTILLIRHGLNDWVGKKLAGWIPGVRLNAAGWAQAEALAQRLKNSPIKMIYASPLERTLETAAPLAAALGLETIPAESLIEADMGDWMGKSLRMLRRNALWQEVRLHPSQFRFPNGESFVETQARMITLLEELRQAWGDADHVACFSHGDNIRLTLDSFQRLVVDPGSISALVLPQKGGVMVQSMNDTGHLNRNREGATVKGASGTQREPA